MSALPASLANNLKRIRTDRRFSLAQLAARSGVGKATLSTIEAGTGNPTLETLQALADALSVQIEELIAHEPESTVEVVPDGAGLDITDSAIQAHLLKTTIAGGAVMEIHDLVLAPGRDEVSATHGVGAREHVLVRAGRLRAGPVGSETEIGPGDYATYPADRPHRWSAVGNEPSRIWVILTFPRVLVDDSGAS